MQSPATKDILSIFAIISNLSNVYRHNAMTFDTARKENVAEHSYALATLGCALAAELNRAADTQLDVGKIAQYALVHDLAELFMKEGDVSVYAPARLLAAKKSAEGAAIARMKRQTKNMPWIGQTVDEYEAQSTAEAQFVYALDKIIVHMIVIISNHHHAKPTFARYKETEETARQKISNSFPPLLPYFEDLCRAFKERPHLFEDEPA